MSVLERISCRNFLVIDGYAYFSNWFYNGLFKVNIETGEAYFLSYFKEEKFSEINIHGEIFRKKNEIFFCPQMGSYLHIYDIKRQIMNAIEIRKKHEDFVIKDVVLGEDSVSFIPLENNYSVRKVDLKMWEVTEESKGELLYGKYMSQGKDMFPVPELLKELHIEYIKAFFWNQQDNRDWYGFLPKGSELLYYTKDERCIKKKPITVLNRAELERYLCKVKNELKNELINPGIGERRIGRNLQDYIYILSEDTFLNNDIKNKYHIGTDIWNSIEQS